MCYSLFGFVFLIRFLDSTHILSVHTRFHFRVEEARPKQQLAAAPEAAEQQQIQKVVTNEFTAWNNPQFNIENTLTTN